MENHIPTIVVDGGPCAGKTSLRAVVEQRISALGYHVLWRPEAATDLILAGINPWSNPQFQRMVIDFMACWNDWVLDAAYAVPKPVIFKDRGFLSGGAYCDKTELEKTLVKIGIHSHVQAWNECDAVIFLRSAAVGAEKFYTTENNSARKETLNQARELDEKTLAVWQGHPHLIVIDNSTNFEGKINRALAAIYRVLGIPEPIEIEKRYLVILPDFAELEAIPFEVIDIDQTYLEDGSRVRRRGQYGVYAYYHTIKKSLSHMSRVELERKITAHEFIDLQTTQRDLDCDVIRKTRTCFTWENQYFELDSFKPPLLPEFGGLGILEIELTTEQQEVKLPPFIKVVREITGDKKYSNHELARRGQAR